MTSKRSKQRKTNDDPHVLKIKRAVPTEFMINLNLLASPSDEEIPPFSDMVRRSSNTPQACPEEYERRAAGILLILHSCVPDSLANVKVPLTSIQVYEDGMFTMHIRAIWKDRNPILVGMAKRSEVKNAMNNESVRDLILQEDRLLFSLTNAVDVPDEELGVNYWGDTGWHAMHYFSHNAFVEFCENIVQALMLVPRLPHVDEFKGVLAFGDDRWMTNRKGEDLTDYLTNSEKKDRSDEPLGE